MRSAAHVLDAYGEWLDRQALAARTRSAYRRWVAELLEHLVAGDELDAFLAPAGDDDRRAVLADWRRRLVDRRLAPSTVNLARQNRIDAGRSSLQVLGSVHVSILITWSPYRPKRSPSSPRITTVALPKRRKTA